MTDKTDDFKPPEVSSSASDATERRVENVGEGGHEESGLTNEGFETVTDKQYFSDKKDAIQAYKEWAASRNGRDLFQLEQQNRDRLEEIFDEKFHPEDPPESYRRFERINSLRSLAHGVLESSGNIRYHRDGEITTLVEDDGTPAEKNPEHAKDLIDIMVTYGADAEPYLSLILESTSIPQEVRSHAADVLRELRDEEEKPESFIELVKQWFS